MCDLCSELLDLLQLSEQKSYNNERLWLRKPEVAVVCTYVQGWTQRQCMCCYKEAKQFEAFNNVLQGILHISLEFLNHQSEELQAQELLPKNEGDGDGVGGVQMKTGPGPGNLGQEMVTSDESKGDDTSSHDNTVEQASTTLGQEEWSMEEKERLLHFISKTFLLNFPLYVAYKHSIHSKLEEISQQEASALNIYCDINDPEIPVYLLRNVCFFCDRGGINAMTNVFKYASPQSLSFSMAHAMINVVSNLKLWMNIGSIVQCLVPLRTNVIRYMCKLSDKDLRVAGTRNLSEFMWTAVKDPLDAHLTFDEEGLNLAFKYFISSTLTMRLAGITQINNHINIYNELCNSETFIETESVGVGLAKWLIQNKIIEHIFGPNLHVEIIKQSHIVLNFLAMEGKITNDHIDCIWAAAQLKHCSKQVHDLLPPLIKNLEAQPVLHLYCLLCKLEPKDHTEQTLYLASALIKFIWSNGGGSHGNLTLSEHGNPHAPFATVLKNSVNVTDLEQVGLAPTVKHNASSSEHSVSVEASYSEDDEQSDSHPVHNTSEMDSSQLSDKRLSSNEGSEGGRKERLLSFSKTKRVCRQRQQHRKQAISHREPGEISGMDDSSASSAALDSDMSNVSNDSLPSEEDEVGSPNLAVSSLNTLSDSEDDDDESENEDSPSEEVVDRPRRKIFRRHKLRQLIKATKKKELGQAGNLSKGLCEPEQKELSDLQDLVLKVNAAEGLKLQNAANVAGNIVNLMEQHKELSAGTEGCSIEDSAKPRKLSSGDHVDEEQDHKQRKEAKSELTGNKNNPQLRLGANPDLAAEKKSSKSDANVLSCAIDHSAVPSNTVKTPEVESEPGPSVVFAEPRVSELDVHEFPQLDETLETEVYDCREYLQQMHVQQHLHEHSDLIEDILSPDDGSCSSRISNKSEKNMADFDGEESGCEDELARLAVHADTQLSPHQMQQRFAATIYHAQEAKAHHRCSQKDCNQAVGQFEIDKVCNPGNTLLWDLLQDGTVSHLGEGLAAEAEKVLCNLVCWSTDRLIRMKFIEGCLENLENNRSVVVSLRLLPKLFGSFQPYRGGGMDNHSVTLWAERELKMMKHFFNNLLTYTNSVQLGKKPYTGMYSHQTEIQVRLQFLTCVFSSMGSPESFRLTLEQVGILWSCLATDQECSDELFSWLLNQAKNKDQHAMGLETFKHIFMEKMPLLPPETTSMTALNLYQQLGGITRLTASQNETEEMCGMDQLWGIALRAENTDVSMAAIQYLNSYYVNLHHGTLEKEEEFIERCMTSLRSVSDQFDEAEDARLIIIQRGLLLLKTHLETFHRRYAYHLRLWHLEGRGIVCHQQSLNEKQSSSLRVICQPGGFTDKVNFEFLGSDFVADLRAEITKWWEQFCPQQQLKKQESMSSSQEVRIGGRGDGEGNIEGFIRMISQGQELTSDLDERTLQEMGFKDLQLVFVSMGASRPQRKRDGLEPTSQLPPPPREKLPMVLLLQPPHFEQLFSLMQQLSSLKSSKKNGEWAPLTKGQLLSRRVWELLMMLPTSPSILHGFHNLISNQDQDTQSALCTLLNPDVPQKLIYSLQIVESLSKTTWMQPIEEVVAEQSTGSSWTNQFIKRGGLRHLFDIFMSGRLQVGEGKEWNEWNQDCLAYLLKLINQFGVEPAELEAIHLEAHESYETPKKKMKRNRRGSSDKLIIPRLSEIMLSMMDVDAVMSVLMAVLEQAATTGDPNHYKTGLWGRAQVVHYAIVLLVHWSYSSKAVKPALFSYPHLAKLLKRLLVDDPEPAVRREACTGQYRLCLGTTTDGKSGRKFIVPLLSCLLRFLPETQTMKSVRSELEEDGKEPYGPACRDYFWLVCRLVDHLDEDLISQQDDQCSPLDLDELGRYLMKAILTRDYLESRHGLVDDDGLIGLITLCTALMKHNPSIKFSEEGQEFLLKIFDCLFALPSPKQRYLPKCKSQASRSAAYDLLVELVKGCLENYKALHNCLLQQHSPNSHAPYPWDYWPHEDGRSDCGYVGLTNLGATCYMASCMQHLYMMPQARASILTAKQCNADTKHENTLHELQRMFAYLLESERKSYNPRSFCKVYMMDHQPLNTGEQKDMAEFFTDLISKLEEMTPQLKELVKTLFCGVITNNVVSLDCSHISRTIEESYTVRCQVADMRNLYESLDEVTVKDTLEGDNMYTCSQCGKKVRAEKRACFKKLPKIICFNTMRYTFNMVTMMKEKVNTHFSFPLRLDMSGYTEKHLMPDQYKAEEGQKDDDDVYLYDLIGVTVHTGTADGGHYYSFIKDRTSPNKDKWFLFNDAEVKPFDPAQIAAECFGGEMTSKTYDSVTDKFMDFSFEKTNSAYMLFYERCLPEQGESVEKKPAKSEAGDQANSFELSKELAEWIWQDNMQFLQDKNIFEHTYFNFMWQMCGYIPQTISQHEEVTLMSAKLSTSFVLETLIHAKEKPTMVQWIELLTKQFNASQNACEWFMDHMAENEWWPVQILIKCPNQVVRQMFQRLCIHVINKLKPTHMPLYLQPCTDNEDFTDVDVSQVGLFSCVTRFIRKLLSLTEHGAKQHCKHLTEYFTFLLDFAKMGEEESQFLIAIEAISYLANFYLGQKTTEFVDVVSDEDEDEEDDVVSIVDDKYKPASLEKMITLIATLVEKSRGADHQLHLSQNDFGAVAGGKVFPFLFQQIRDNINIRQTCNLIFSLCRWNDRLTVHIVNMIFQAITKHHDLNQPFFKLLTMLVEFVGGPPGMPSFTNLVLQHIWEVAEYCPQQCLEWLSIQVPRNKIAHGWVLQNMETWVEHFLIAHTNQRVRNSAAYLLVSLVPNHNFRQSFRNVRTMLSPQKDICMNREALMILHQIYELLLRLLKRAKHYVDHPHGTTKLMSYFAVMTYCLHSRTEKLMFGQYFLDLWQLFQPKLSEPPVPVHQNKQALLIFWYQVSVDCPENVKLIVSNAHVTKNIAFNYILADHDDQEVMMFNRCMLPAYYGLLRLCCQQSRVFTRQLANHQNIQWAFKNITPYSTQYPTAIEELFKLMQLFVMKHPDNSEQEAKEILNFKRTTTQLYLTILDARSCWATLIAAFRILLENNEDRLFLLYSNGLPMMFESFHTLHVMYHEATACHVTGDLVELASIILDVLKCARAYRENKEVKHCLANWKDRTDSARKLVTLLNSYTPGDVRQICIEVLRELLVLYPTEILQTLVPMLTQCHATFQENNVAGRAFKEIASGFFTFGPYFPKQGQKPMGSKSNIRPQRPMFQMYLHPNQIEATKGSDEEYDQTLYEFFHPYHHFVDILCRMAINTDAMMEPLINLSAMVGFEGIPLHFTLFPKLWVEICLAEHLDKKYVEMLCSSNYLVDYLETVLIDERTSLNIPIIYEFCSLFLPKVYHQVTNEQLRQQLNNLTSSMTSYLETKDLEPITFKLNGDLRVISVLLKCENLQQVEPAFIATLQQLKSRCEVYRQRSLEESSPEEPGEKEGGSPSLKRRKLEDEDSNEKCSETPETEENEAPSKPSGSQMVLVQAESLPKWNETLIKTINELLLQIQDASGTNS